VTSEDPQADGTAFARRRAHVVHAVAIVVILAGVLRYYDPADGFTSLVGFGGVQAGSIIPALKELPHKVYRGTAGYDGQFYVQMAMDPLLERPSTDRAMDEAPLRARRILLAWTAFALGFGRPAWILQAFALQNVLTWIALTFVLRWWFDLTTRRGLALWLVTLFSAGLLWSIRLSLLDGPSLLLLALAVGAIESGRRWTGAIVCGIAGLARETNVLSVFGLIDPARWKDWRSMVRQAGLVALALLPLALWFDYIHAIYRSAVFTSGETLASPFAGMLWRAGVAVRDVEHGIYRPAWATLAIIVAFATQIGWLVARPRWREPWWRIGVAYAAMLPFLGQPLWVGGLGTVIRVELPLLLAFNIGLRTVKSEPLFWLLLACGNGTVLLQPLFP
jgi:hypothetical protein